MLLASKLGEHKGGPGVVQDSMLLSDWLVRSVLHVKEGTSAVQFLML